MKKKFIFDTILNLTSSLLPLFVLQFWILPQVAKNIDGNSYGQLISIIAFVNLSASSFGGALNNSRLITFKEQDEDENRRDYNFMLVMFSIMNVFFVFIGVANYGEDLNSFSKIIIILISSFMLYKTYSTVEFRIDLNFKKILNSNMFLFIGYFIGYVIFIYTYNWIYIYLFGFLLASIYIYAYIPHIKKPFNISEDFYNTLKKTTVLLGSGFLASAVAYIDKLLIFPLIGGYAVAIYYTSTVLGKTIASVMVPITSVILSYLAQLKSFSNKNFLLLMSISSLIGLIGYIVIILISEPFLNILYPQYVEESMVYIPITTLSIVITILGNIINSVILKFRKINWQVYINLVHLIFYLAFALIFLNLWDLYGFCVGILVASIIRLILLIFVYYKRN